MHVIINERGEEFTVDPESVVRLVGYDADGREVCEGDILVDCDGLSGRATLSPEVDFGDTVGQLFYSGTA
ncbi:MAG: hypothetical protein IJ774_02205 [Selenomonadaceae bacterium]|nr:hypothetical protein [Selenomonadaceae bacterium]